MVFEKLAAAMSGTVLAGFTSYYFLNLQMTKGTEQILGRLKDVSAIRMGGASGACLLLRRFLTCPPPPLAGFSLPSFAATLRTCTFQVQSTNAKLLLRLEALEDQVNDKK